MIDEQLSNTCSTSSVPSLNATRHASRALLPSAPPFSPALWRYALASAANVHQFIRTVFSAIRSASWNYYALVRTRRTRVLRNKSSRASHAVSRQPLTRTLPPRARALLLCRPSGRKRWRRHGTRWNSNTSETRSHICRLMRTNGARGALRAVPPASQVLK